MCHHAELILDTFRYVKPMKLSVKKLRQAAVKLPRAGDHTSRLIQCSLQLVCRDLGRRRENCVTVIDAGRHECVNDRTSVAAESLLTERRLRRS